MAPRSCSSGSWGKGRPGRSFADLLVGVHQVAKQLDGHLGVGGGARQLLGRVEQGVELLAGDAEHDAPVHGHEPTVRVVGEALVVGLLGQALDRVVVEAEVEDGVHHAGHRELGPRPDRDEQGVARVPDALAHGSLETGARPRHLGGEAVGPPALHVGAAGGRGDGEPVRDGQSEDRGHLGQVGALAAEQVLHLHRRLAMGVGEVEDKGHRTALLTSIG